MKPLEAKAHPPCYISHVVEAIVMLLLSLLLFRVHFKAVPSPGELHETTHARPPAKWKEGRSEGDQHVSNVCRAQSPRRMYRPSEIICSTTDVQSPIYTYLCLRAPSPSHPDKNRSQSILSRSGQIEEEKRSCALAVSTEMLAPCSRIKLKLAKRHTRDDVCATVSIRI